MRTVLELLRCLVRLVPGRALLATLEHVIHPVVLEGVRVGVEALGFRNDLDLLIVVRSPSIGPNHGFLEVRVLKVGA